MLKQFTAGTTKYGFVEGSKGYIVSDNDFCHQVRTLSENIELRTRTVFEEGGERFQVFTVAELREIAEPIKSFFHWAHYWGIKSRVGANYHGLLTSMREIGASVNGMPKFGEEPKQVLVTD